MTFGITALIISALSQMTRHNDILNNDTRHHDILNNETQHNGTQHNHTKHNWLNCDTQYT